MATHLFIYPQYFSFPSLCWLLKFGKEDFLPKLKAWLFLSNSHNGVPVGSAVHSPGTESIRSTCFTECRDLISQDSEICIMLPATPPNWRLPWSALPSVGIHMLDLLIIQRWVQDIQLLYAHLPQNKCEIDQTFNCMALTFIEPKLYFMMSGMTLHLNYVL